MQTNCSLNLNVLAEELVRDLLKPAPRPLDHIKAELIILDDNTYVFHYRDATTGAEQFKPVSPQTVQVAFSDGKIDSGWFDPSIVRWGKSNHGEYVVQWIAPQKLSIRIGNDRLRIPMPGLIWIAQRSTYWIIAAQTRSFDPKAPAFHAPVANVNPSQHYVCWGNITPPQASATSITKAWQAFVESQFNSDWSQGKSVQHPSDINTKLKSLVRAKRYPTTDLVPIRSFDSAYSTALSVEAVINHFIQT